jgi:transcriptional regulator with XRE-family HTH domain
MPRRRKARKPPPPIGVQIRKRREELGDSLRDVMHNTDDVISAAAVQRIEQQLRDNPKLATLEALSIALKCRFEIEHGQTRLVAE